MDLAATPVGADMLGTTKANALVCVHKDTSLHVLSPYDRFPLKKGSAHVRCNLQELEPDGLSPDDIHHESRSCWVGFLVFPLRSDRMIRAVSP